MSREHHIDNELSQQLPLPLAQVYRQAINATTAQGEEDGKGVASKDSSNRTYKNTVHTLLDAAFRS